MQCPATITCEPKVYDKKQLNQCMNMARDSPKTLILELTTEVRPHNSRAEAKTGHPSRKDSPIVSDPARNSRFFLAIKLLSPFPNANASIAETGLGCTLLPIYVYIYIHIYTPISTYLYIYIYRNR